MIKEETFDRLVLVFTLIFSIIIVFKAFKSGLTRNFYYLVLGLSNFFLYYLLKA